MKWGVVGLKVSSLDSHRLVTDHGFTVRKLHGVSVEGVAALGAVVGVRVIIEERW